MIDRYNGSPTNNAIINGISEMIYGKGLDATDSAAIDDFLNFNTPNLDNIEPDILGDYIRDEDKRRIFRPKIN